ncbi:DNA-binding phage protein [Streptococcus pyogenes]|uniref:XRE family transcriptional regulator n=1 Tax=Streptococcus pyogenes TaxID=1314 RepID=UPI000DA3CB76|nr:XRE family transcriptional regulator [Streptococcus pyogenes]SQH23794.1 DNA-binding phage protein [Streptococcus pyogenes]
MTLTLSVVSYTMIITQNRTKYEKDSTNIPFELLKELSAIYQVKMDDIFLGDSTKKIELNKREVE